MKVNKTKVVSFLKWTGLLVILLSSRFLAIGETIEGQLNFLAGFIVAVCLGVILFTEEVANLITKKCWKFKKK